MSIREVLLVTGMTGAGRSTTAKVLEDLGWFVIDNLPPQLLEQTIALLGKGASDTRLAVVVDARSRWFFSELEGSMAALRETGMRPSIVFLDASDDVLVRRQEAARRPHPLMPEGRLLDGIEAEREMLRVLRGRADVLVDTSHLNVHQLAARITTAFADPETQPIRATVVSFGFKYGIPADADMVADMRFLPNPFWVPELRHQTGLNEPVRDYVYAATEAVEFLDNYEALLKGVARGFVREGKRFLSIAIACTGGTQ